MAITTFAELKAALQNWSGRGTADTDFNARLPEFIALFEAHARDAIKTRQAQKKDSALSLNAEYVNLPADFTSMDSLALLTTPRRPLDYMPSSAMDQQYGAVASGMPEVYCIENNQLRLGPTPDATYTARITYYYQLSLSDSQTTNWLLTAYPTAYLYGALHEFHLWSRDDQGAAGSRGLRDEVIARINAQNRTNAVAGQLQARPDFVVA